jgi:hypothetical protein
MNDWMMFVAWIVWAVTLTLTERLRRRDLRRQLDVAQASLCDAESRATYWRKQAEAAEEALNSSECVAKNLRIELKAAQEALRVSEAGEKSWRDSATERRMQLDAAEEALRNRRDAEKNLSVERGQLVSACKEWEARNKHLAENREGLLATIRSLHEQVAELQKRDVRQVVWMTDAERREETARAERDAAHTEVARLNALRDRADARIAELEEECNSWRRGESEALDERDAARDEVAKLTEECAARKSFEEAAVAARDKADEELARVRGELLSAIEGRNKADAEVARLDAVVREVRYLMNACKEQPAEDKPPETDEWRVGDEVLTPQGPGVISHIGKWFVTSKLGAGTECNCSPSLLKRPDPKPPEDWKVGDRVTWTDIGGGTCRGQVTSLSVADVEWPPDRVAVIPEGCDHVMRILRSRLRRLPDQPAEEEWKIGDKVAWVTTIGKSLRRGVIVALQDCCGPQSVMVRPECGFGPYSIPRSELRRLPDQPNKST